MYEKDVASLVQSIRNEHTDIVGCLVGNDGYSSFAMREMHEDCATSLVESIRNESDDMVGCVVGDKSRGPAPDDSNACPPIRIRINYEHTMVKVGGRDAEGAPFSNTIVAGTDERYLCRVCDIDNLVHKSDIIIDYSLSNIVHIKDANLGGPYEMYVRKCICIAPMLFSTNQFEKGIRHHDTLSSFIRATTSDACRRGQFLRDVPTRFPSHTNIRTLENEELRAKLLDTKVLINVHQTDHHATLEELRILPALQCGVLVVSERAGLMDVVPYQHMIVWSSYDQILDTVEDVLTNYDTYHAKIFTPENCKLIERMHDENRQRLETRLVAMNMSLDTISRKYALDKNVSTYCHDYIPNYTMLFQDLRFQAKRVLEIGIGVVEHGQMSGVLHLGYQTGNSLRCWRDYFLYADVFGVDIYPSGMKNEDRITTFVADQSSKEDMKRVMETIGGPCDVIIDDGSHLLNHQVATFMYLSEYVNPNGGVYVIEDIQREYDRFPTLEVFPEPFRQHIKEHYEVQVFDTRHKRGRSDDFMVAFIRKK